MGLNNHIKISFIRKKEGRMKVFAVNSSPRVGDLSKTELMLDHLVEGMREAGAEVDVINLRDKKIKHCQGCFTCWTKTPGRCIHKDDMTRELFPKWLESDLAVYASPLYFHKMNSVMSTFVERTLPVAHPFFEQGDNGNVYHPLRTKVPAAVWLSVCGFPEDAEFDALSNYLNQTRHKDARIAAEIYRPAAESMVRPQYKEKLEDILDATKQAGRELVQGMKVAPATMARIRQPIVDSKNFAQLGNLMWKGCIAEGVTPKTFLEKKMVPRPDSLDSFMLLCPMGLNPRAGAGKKTVLQFNFSGQVKASCYFSIAKGIIDAKTGVANKADLVIDTPFDLWMDIMTRKADGQQMFMEQKYTVKGDLGLMMQMFKREEDA
jgi:multimeric flavodoxin WrbA